MGTELGLKRCKTVWFLSNAIKRQKDNISCMRRPKYESILLVIKIPIKLQSNALTR